MQQGEADVVAALQSMLLQGVHMPNDGSGQQQQSDVLRQQQLHDAAQFQQTFTPTKTHLQRTQQGNAAAAGGGPSLSLGYDPTVLERKRWTNYHELEAQLALSVERGRSAKTDKERLAAKREGVVDRLAMNVERLQQPSGMPAWKAAKDGTLWLGGKRVLGPAEGVYGSSKAGAADRGGTVLRRERASDAALRRYIAQFVQVRRLKEQLRTRKKEYEERYSQLSDARKTHELGKELQELTEKHAELQDVCLSLVQKVRTMNIEVSVLQRRARERDRVVVTREAWWDRNPEGHTSNPSPFGRAGIKPPPAASRQPTEDSAAFGASPSMTASMALASASSGEFDPETGEEIPTYDRGRLVAATKLEAVRKRKARIAHLKQEHSELRALLAHRCGDEAGRAPFVALRH